MPKSNAVTTGRSRRLTRRLVIIGAVDLTDDEKIVATCGRGPWRQRIPILDLPLPAPPPGGAEWIEAYRHWVK